MIPPEHNRTIRKSYRYLDVAHQTGSSLAFSCSNYSHITPPTRSPGCLCRERRRYRKREKRWHSGDSTGCRRLPPISVLCISADAVNSYNMKSIMYRLPMQFPTLVLCLADSRFLLLATKCRRERQQMPYSVTSRHLARHVCVQPEASRHPWEGNK